MDYIFFGYFVIGYLSLLPALYWVGKYTTKKEEEINLLTLFTMVLIWPAMLLYIAYALGFARRKTK